MSANVPDAMARVPIPLTAAPMLPIIGARGNQDEQVTVLVAPLSPPVVTVLVAPLSPPPAAGVPVAPPVPAQTASLALSYSSPEAPLRDALEADSRLGTQECLYLLEFFEHLGLRLVADLRDIEALEPLSSYLRGALEEYEAAHTKASGGARAALGRIVKAVLQEQESPTRSRLDDLPQEATAVSAFSTFTSDLRRADTFSEAQSLSQGGVEESGQYDSPTRGGRGAGHMLSVHSSPRQPRRSLGSPQVVSRAASPRSSRARPSVSVATGYAGSLVRQPHSAPGSSPSKLRTSSPGRDQGYGGSPMRQQHSTPGSSPSMLRASSPGRDQGLDSTFGRRSPSESMRGSFSQAGSRQGTCRTTAWSQPVRETSPGPGPRPTYERASSPRAVIGTTKRPELWGKPEERITSNVQIAGSTGAAPHIPQAPAHVIGTASRFTYDSQFRPGWTPR
mmetsp:Transcript_72986/g.237306  ORF Transcript_72986/g.237306 Transcript_72986/m.237306 type:complete len:449 (+) Transcript_72986:57-1403(+)